MEALIKKIDESINMINKTTDLFYQEKISEGYNALNVTLSMINTIAGLLYEQQEEEYRDYFSKLNVILKEAMDALEMKDLIMLADIFQYELKELFEDLHKYLKQKI